VVVVCKLVFNLWFELFELFVGHTGIHTPRGGLRYCGNLALAAAQLSSTAGSRAASRWKRGKDTRNKYMHARYSQQKIVFKIMS
jgi:hypothetical protein